MKKDYMTQLERAARWRLPRQEAEDVIADYRDIISHPPRSEEELRREVGDPEKVIQMLVSPTRAYRVWLAAFILMAACILTLGFSPTAIGYPFWFAYFDSWHGNHLGPAAAVLGAVLTLVWFRWQGFKSEKHSKAVPILLAVLTVWTGVIIVVFCLVARDPVGFSEALGQVPSWIGPDRMESLSNRILNAFLAYSGVLMALLGTFALVRARTQDRRWAAVYVLAIAAVLIPLEMLALFTCMDPIFDITTAWYLPYLGQYAAIFAAGMVGAGVALC